MKIFILILIAFVILISCNKNGEETQNNRVETIKVLIKLNIPISKLKEKGYSLTDFLEADVEIEDLLMSGYLASELWDKGVTLSELSEANIGIIDLLFLENVSISKILNETNYTLSDFVGLEGISLNEFVDDGVSVADIIKYFNPSINELYEAGIGVGLLRKNNFSESELENAGLVGMLNDVDGNIYKWVKIGSQYWMAENLRVTHFSDGTPIRRNWSYLSPAVYNMGMPTDQAFCWPGNDSVKYAKIYGGFYTWAAAMKGSYNLVNDQGVCPTGWHIPSEDEWKTLELQLGVDKDELIVEEHSCRGENSGEMLKKEDYWGDNNIYTDNSGFGAMPAGFSGEHCSGSFCTGMGTMASWWSSTKSPFESTVHWPTIWRRTVFIDKNEICNRSWDNGFGRSVRCLKDVE